ATTYGWGATAGYDKTDPNQRGAFPKTLQRRDVTIGNWLSMPFAVFLAPSPSGSGCYGDSGGPLLVPTADGGRAVAGVFTYVSRGCRLGDAGANGFTRTTPFLPWLESVAGPLPVAGEVEPGGLTLVGPTRLVDTRVGLGGPPGRSDEIRLDLSSRAPAGATAVVANLTAPAQAGVGRATAGRCQGHPAAVASSRPA